MEHIEKAPSNHFGITDLSVDPSGANAVTRPDIVVVARQSVCQPP